MYCKNCGRKLKSDEVYCSKFGTLVNYNCNTAFFHEKNPNENIDKTPKNPINNTVEISDSVSKKSESNDIYKNLNKISDDVYKKTDDSNNKNINETNDEANFEKIRNNATDVNNNSNYQVYSIDNDFGNKNLLKNDADNQNKINDNFMIVDADEIQKNYENHKKNKNNIENPKNDVKQEFTTKTKTNELDFNDNEAKIVLVDDAKTKSSNSYNANSKNNSNHNQGYNKNKKTQTKKDVDFGEAYCLFWKNYFNFSDTATLKETFYPVIWDVIIAVLLSLISIPLSLIIKRNFFIELFSYGLNSYETAYYILTGIYTIITIIPTVSLIIRRLKTLKRSPFAIFIWLVPIVGQVLLIIYLCLPKKDF